MAYDIRYDLIVDSSISYGFDTKTMVRIILVDHIPTSGATDATIMNTALTAVLTAIPYGTPHPADSSCLSTGYDVRPLGGRNNAKIAVTYSKRFFPGDNPVLFEWDGALSNLIIDHDKTGTPIVTKWYISTVPGAAVSGDFKLATGGTTTILKPYLRMNVKKWFNIVGTPIATMETYINTYLGKVNSDTWHGGIAYTWMCQNIHSSSPDGAWYLLDHQFIYNPLTHYGFMAYTKDNGHRPSNLFRGYNMATVPPTELTTNNGFKIVDSYNTVAFSGLGF